MSKLISNWYGVILTHGDIQLQLALPRSICTQGRVELPTNTTTKYEDLLWFIVKIRLLLSN